MRVIVRVQSVRQLAQILRDQMRLEIRRRGFDHFRIAREFGHQRAFVFVVEPRQMFQVRCR